MKPRVSVVVPTYLRPALLLRCLDALAKQTLAKDEYEVIVVSDGPDASLRAKLEALPSPVRFFELPRNRGPAAARNCGWRAAAAPVVAFTDDDTVPAPDWLEEGLAALGAGHDAVAGQVVVPVSPDPTDYERDAAQLANSEFVTANCFVTVAMLTAVGGFDERFRYAWREDSDLHFALLARGAGVGRAPRARVLHPVRPAAWGVSLKQQRKVLFDALLYKKHRGLYRERIRRHPRFDYYAAAAALIAAPVAYLLGAPVIAFAALALWLAWTCAFAARRLRGTRREWRHVGEMLVTSAAIPVLAVWWRLLGAVRYRVVFL